MSKLSKQATKNHEQAQQLVDGTAKLIYHEETDSYDWVKCPKQDKPLTIDEKIYVLQNWNPQASHNVGKTGTFFTPYDLARDLSIEVVGIGTIVDACAGIGALSLAEEVMGGGGAKHICIENNPTFVEVGKRILPDATWIQGDAFDAKTWDKIGSAYEVISNPPFLKIKPTNFTGLKYAGGKSTYVLAEIALQHVKFATFIVDQGSCPFRFSGCMNYQQVENKEYTKFREQTGIIFEATSIDTSVYLSQWSGVSTQVEVVHVKREEQ